jgi:hypothetical protein
MQFAIVCVVVLLLLSLPSVVVGCHLLLFLVNNVAIGVYKRCRQCCWLSCFLSLLRLLLSLPSVVVAVGLAARRC